MRFTVALQCFILGWALSRHDHVLIALSATALICFILSDIGTRSRKEDAS